MKQDTNYLAIALLSELQAKFKNSAVTITMRDYKSETDCIHFNADVKDEFVNSGLINFTDKFISAIEKIFRKHGLKAHFNNNNSIFWCFPNNPELNLK